MSKKVEMVVVQDCCIYINDHRIVGRKPYASENLKTKTYSVGTDKLLDQLDFDEIKKYVKERESNE